MAGNFVFAGKGDVYLDILTDAGVSTGLELKGECTTLEIKTDAERKDLIGRGRDTDGQVIASIVRPKPTTIKFNFKKVDADLFAMAMAGTTASLNQSSGTATDQAVTVKLGKGVELGKINISATGFTVTNEAETTTYVLDTDYTVNYRLGILTALSTGAITDAQSLKVSYSYLATTGSTVLGGKKYSIRAGLVLDGQNLEDGRNFILKVPRTRISTDSAVDFLKDDFMELSLSGVVELPTGATEAFRADFLD